MFSKFMKSIENNFDDPNVNDLLVKHFKELRSVSPEGSSHKTLALNSGAYGMEINWSDVVH